MGFESSFTLYRKHLKYGLASDARQKIVDKYVEYNKKNDWRTEDKESKDYSDDLPIVMNNTVGMEYEDYKHISLPELRNKYFIDDCPADKLLDINFCSNSRFICDEFCLGHGGTWKSHEKVIDKTTAEKMLQAIRYLLHGEYSKKIENAIGNEWIKIFGNEYPKYYHKKSKNIYLDRIERGSYKISFGDEDAELEYEEDNQSMECMMTEIAAMLTMYLNCDYCYDNDTELVLVYSISY